MKKGETDMNRNSAFEVDSCIFFKGVSNVGKKGLEKAGNRHITIMKTDNKVYLTDQGMGRAIYRCSPHMARPRG